MFAVRLHYLCPERATLRMDRLPQKVPGLSINSTHDFGTVAWGREDTDSGTILTSASTCISNIQTFCSEPDGFFNTYETMQLNLIAVFERSGPQSSLIMLLPVAEVRVMTAHQDSSLFEA